MREVYLYQTVHILDGESLCLREHLAVLDRWSRTLFGCPGPQDAREVGTAIAAVAGREAPGSDRSKFVRLVLPASGSLRLEFEGVSLYRGYDLRSLMPEAVTLQYEPPLFDAPTSAREAAVELARQYAGLQGASVAVRCDRNGTLMAADEAALFAIRGRRVYAPPGEASIGRSLAVRSIRAAGLELAEAPVGRDDLPRMDELFFIDHRGVTALSRCDGQPYMAIFAERIAVSEYVETLPGRHTLSSPQNPETMKKYLFLYAVLTTALLAYGYARYRHETRRLTQNQDALASGIEHYRTRLGQEAASVQALRLRCAEFERLRAEDAASIRRLGIKLRRLEAAAKTVTATSVDLRAPVRDTVVLLRRDTLRIRDTLKLFRWRDAWVTVEGRIRTDSVACRVESTDTLRQVVHRVPRRFLFIRWGTKALRQEIVSSNPHTRIVYSDYVKFER